MTGLAVWGSDEWVAAATRWLDDVLAGVDRPRIAAVEQPHLRPWGTVLRAPTAEGTVWLKAPASDAAIEVTLLPVLAEIVPDEVPVVLAADSTRGWVAMTDAGERLDKVEHHDLPGRFTAEVVRYGRLQRALMPHLDELFAAGVVDMTPAALPGRFDEVVAELRSGPLVSAEVHRRIDRIAAARSRLVAQCTELAASALRPSLDHNDLHDGNILVDAGGHTRLIDWGDAVVAHPFAALLVPEQVLASLAEDAPRDRDGDLPQADGPRALPDAVGADTSAKRSMVMQLRRDYLAGFAADAPHEDLARTAELAVTTAQVARAWVWARAVRSAAAAGDDLAEFATAPLEHLSWWCDRQMTPAGQCAASSQVAPTPTETSSGTVPSE